MSKSTKTPPQPKYQLPVFADADQLAAIEAHPDILQVIGEIAARWSIVELHLTGTLAVLLGDYHRVNVVLYTLGSFKARSDVVRNVVTELGSEGEAKEEILWLLGKLQDAHTARNEIIHAMWGINSVTNTASRHVRKPGTKTPFKMEVASKETLKQHSNRVAALAVRLSQLTHPAKPRLRSRSPA